MLTLVTRLEDDPSLLEGRLLILDEAQKVLLTLENLSRKSYLLTDLLDQTRSSSIEGRRYASKTLARKYSF